MQDMNSTSNDKIVRPLTGPTTSFEVNILETFLWVTLLKRTKMVRMNVQDKK